MPRILPGPPCHVCGKPSQARNLCNTHLKRFYKYGHTEPSSYGTHRKHPLYESWRWTARDKCGRTETWEIFENFLADVGEAPSNLHRLRRYDTNKPWGPANFFWQETVASSTDAKEYAKLWRKNNRLREKNTDLKKHYGITLEEYSAILEEQAGGCAICGILPGRQMLAVDHCHNTKKVRGLLCSNCNMGLGALKDSSTLLEKAIKYLEKHSGRNT